MHSTERAEKHLGTMFFLFGILLVLLLSHPRDKSMKDDGKRR